jgi:hypothetical protein
MRYRHVLPLLLAAVGACGGDAGTTAPPPPVPTVLLKDIAIPNLPSPFYHFEYDAAGRIRGASFASGFTIYAVTYERGRIQEMRNTTLGNQDRLEYHYDDAGRVSRVQYVAPSGAVTTTVTYSYVGPKLTRVERQRVLNGNFVVDKILSLSYYADGNLLELTDHRLRVDGFQEEATIVDRFEQYDDKINVDGFSLLHNDFFDHLVLLPEVQLQKGNPARILRSGDADHFVLDYVYTYDEQNRPLAKDGTLTFTSGPHTGETFPSNSVFTYY